MPVTASESDQSTYYLAAQLIKIISVGKYAFSFYIEWEIRNLFTDSYRCHGEWL